MSAYRVSYLSDPREIAQWLNVVLKKTGPLALSADQLTLTVDRALSVTGNFGVSGYYTVAGTQVVGPRGAAVADATNATDVITQLNALLARCRAHGLIA